MRQNSWYEKKEIRVKLKLYNTCIILALLYGLEAWGKIGKDEMNEIETIRRRALKRIFSLPISKSYNCYRMETDK